MTTRVADVAVIGAGLAGAAAATVLARKGARVLLLDEREQCPPVFKAEKVESEHRQLFDELGLAEPWRPRAARITLVIEAQSGRVLRTVRTDQYGLPYADLVNAIRESLPSGVEFLIDRPTAIDAAADHSTVTFAGGGAKAVVRLVVLACGSRRNGAWPEGLERRLVRVGHSLAFGFDVTPRGGAPFRFDSMTYWPDGAATGIAYLTLFRMLSGMRGNLFTYWSASDVTARRFWSNPERVLKRALPGLESLTGDFDVAGRPVAARIDLHQTEGHLRPGLVLLGDAFQSVCPTTGDGLAKVLTDVKTLADLAPQWLATPGMGTDKIAQFYRQPEKVAADRRSLLGAEYCRRLATDRSLAGDASRALRRWQHVWSFWRRPIEAWRHMG